MKYIIFNWKSYLNLKETTSLSKIISNLPLSKKFKLVSSPNNFFNLLEENNLKIEKKIIFPDHYKFSENEIKNILYEAKKLNLKVIMTEKDFFKINDLKLENVSYLKVILEIKEIKFEGNEVFTNKKLIIIFNL